MSIQLFENEILDLSLTTIVTDDGEIFFKAREVATALGYTNPPKAIRDHVGDKYKLKIIDIKGVNDSFTPSNYQAETVFVSEPGLYSLIFSSKLEAAETFQDWVFSSVLPSIRKTGSYTITDPIEKMRSISYHDLSTYDRDQLKEYKVILRTHTDMLKNPRKVSKGRKGGLTTQERRRELMEKLVRLEQQQAFNDAFRALSMIGVDV